MSARSIILSAAGSSGPDVSTWSAHTLPTTSVYTGAAYGAGLFLAVATATYATSPDGVTWTARTSPTAAAAAAAYGAGVFVILVTSSTTFYTSADGIAWTSRTGPWPGASIFPNQITYANGLFVATCGLSTSGAGDSASSNKCYTSPDGITWTLRTLPASWTWQAAAYGGGIWVAVTSGTANAASSVDGFTWVSRTLPASGNWTCVAYGSGRFVALRAESTAAAYSTDGLTWTAFTAPLSQATHIVSVGDVFVYSVGYSASQTTCYTSTDGATWATRSGLPSARWGAIAYGAGRFLIVGGYSGSTTNQCVTAP